MRAAIYGAGAMGTVLGAFITAAGKEIDLITRNREHVSALRQRGARICGGAHICVNVNALTPEEMSGRYDIIFLMTKQQRGEDAALFLKNFLKDGGAICTLQNGLPEHAVKEAVGSDRCLGCAVSWGATFISSGEAELTSKRKKMTFALGAMQGAEDKLPLAKELLGCAGKVSIVRNLEGARWAKLAINCAFSSLSAITGMTFGEVGKNKITRAVALDILNEVFAVADAANIRLEKIQGFDIKKLFSYKSAFKRKIALALLALAMRNHGQIVSGMYFDLKNKKECEIDFINGAVGKTAERFAVATPVNDKILSIAHEIGRGERDITRDFAL